MALTMVPRVCGSRFIVMMATRPQAGHRARLPSSSFRTRSRFPHVQSSTSAGLRRRVVVLKVTSDAGAGLGGAFRRRVLWRWGFGLGLGGGGGGFPMVLGTMRVISVCGSRTLLSSRVRRQLGHWAWLPSSDGLTIR